MRLVLSTNHETAVKWCGSSTMDLIISSILIGQEWRDYNYDDITVISMHAVKSRIGGTFNNCMDYTETIVYNNN